MQLDPKSTALVVIDLQKGILAQSTAPHPSSAVYERSMQLAQRFRATDALVVRVRVAFSAGFVDALRQPVDQPVNFAAMGPDWAEFPEPVPAPDLVITKRQWNAFYGTELDLQLRRRGICRIVLGGISSSIGVEGTARSAAELGYELVAAEDLCSAAHAEMHAHSFKYILPRLARVTSSAAISLG